MSGACNDLMLGRRKPAVQGGRRREGLDEEKDKTALCLLPSNRERPSCPVGRIPGSLNLPQGTEMEHPTGSWLGLRATSAGTCSSDTDGDLVLPAHTVTHTCMRTCHTLKEILERNPASGSEEAMQSSVSFSGSGCCPPPLWDRFLDAFPSSSSSGVSGPLPDRRWPQGRWET